MKKRQIESVRKDIAPSASVVDNTLILSLPDAVTPVVWRLDLGQTKASALEVREKEGLYMLILKTPRGDVNEIAPYDNKQDAVRALMAVGHAMERAENPKAPANDSRTLPAIVGEPRRRRGFLGKSLSALAAIVVIALVMTLIMNIGPRRAGMPSAETASGDSEAAIAPATGGEPVSADAFLQQNR